MMLNTDLPGSRIERDKLVDRQEDFFDRKIKQRMRLRIFLSFNFPVVSSDRLVGAWHVPGTNWVNRGQ